MKKANKNKYEVKPEDFLALVSQINMDNGFKVPENVAIARNRDFRESLIRLLTISPNKEFKDELEASLLLMENDKSNIPLHISEFSKAIAKFKETTEAVMSRCKGSFAIMLVTLKIFQIKSLEQK